MMKEATANDKGPDRSTPPPVHDIERVEFIPPQEHRLSNGIPLYEMHGGTEEVVRVELMFQAGVKYQDRPGLANAVNELLKEGTTKRSAREISEAIEHYGVSFEQKVDRDHAWIGFSVLSEYLQPLLEILREILEEAAFPQEEVDHYLDQQKDELLEEREKVSFLAKQRFFPVVFGADHPYGSSIEDSQVLDRIDRDSVLEFYQKHYLRKGGVTLFLSGKSESWMIESLDRHLGGGVLAGGSAQAMDAGSANPSENKAHSVQKDGALQAALRIGKPLFGRSHEDYPGMVVLSTLLGGYFGSRLMMNIREDKGYTYGIGAGVFPLQDGGFFTIATEVGSHVREAALEEVQKELQRLQDEEVAVEELDHVRKYIQGNLLRSADGPFAMANLFKNVYSDGADLSYYDRLMETVNSITPQRIQELAREHLSPRDMYTVTAGDLKE